MTQTLQRIKAPTQPEVDFDQQFKGIADNFAVVDTTTAKVPKGNRITVMLNLKHLKDYGHNPNRALVYGCDFAVAVGDLVNCPPTPRKKSWTVGMVVALDGGNYKGKVKYVRKAHQQGQG